LTRTLDASQDEVVRSSSLAALTLIKLDLYSDRGAETVGETFYFSDRPVKYDYGNTGTDREFGDYLISLGELFVSMNHLPAPRDTDLIRKDIRVTLSNETRNGQRLSERLRATYNVENASIEISQILRRSVSGVRSDLSALTGDEHTVLYRGRVKSFGPVTEETLELACETELPTLAWARSDDDTLAPLSALGVRAPLPYGTVRVQATAFEAGPCTNLTAILEEAATTLTGGDFSRFSSSGSVMVGNEEVTYSGKTATTLTGLTRAANGTVDREHRIGERVCEIAQEKHVVAMREGTDAFLNSINAVYTQHPLREGELVQLVLGRHYTTVTNDTTLKTGWAATYADISASQLRQLFNDLIVGELLTDALTVDSKTDQTLQGSVVTKSDSGTPGTTNISRVIDNTAGTSPANESDWDQDGGVTIDWVIPDNHTNITNQRIQFHFSSSNADSDQVNIWDRPFGEPGRTLVGTVNATNNPGGSVNFTLPAAYKDQTSFDFAATNGDVQITEIYLLYDYDEVTGTINYFGQAETFPLTLFADVTGPKVPLPFTQVQEGDSVVIGTSPVTIDPGDAAAEWNALGVPVDDTVIHVDGSSLKFTLTNAPSIFAFSNTDNLSPNEDWTGKWVRFRFRHDSATPGTLDIRVHSGTNINTDYKVVTIDVSGTSADTWYTIGFAPNTGMETGSFDVTSVNMISLFYELTGTSGDFMWIDELATVTASGNVYGGAVGDPIEHPADVFRHLCEQVLSITVDETSVVAAQTNLGTDKLAADLRTFGISAAEVLARLAYHSRANIVPEEAATGTEWKFLTAETDYDWPAAGATLAEWDPGGITELGRDLDQLATRHVAHYAPDPSLGDFDSLYGGIVLANPDESDVSVTTGQLTTAEADFGRIDAAPVAFVGISEEATAEEVFGYYVHEAIRIAALVAIAGVPWWEGYTVEVGDILTVTLPWRASSIKVRVLEYRKSFDTEQIELRGVEVA
jgi:hypothetical protein